MYMTKARSWLAVFNINVDKLTRNSTFTLIAYVYDGGIFVALCHKHKRE